MILPRILKEHEYWLRLVALLYFFRPQIYSDIFYRICKIPNDPRKIFDLFSRKKGMIKQLLKRDKITQAQYYLLYPDSGRVDINRFDLTLFIFVLRNFTKLKPKGGWVKVNQLHRNDKSKGARLVELEHLYKENLATNEAIMFHRFEDDWDELSYYLRALKCDTKAVHELKHCRLTRSNIPVEFITAIMLAQVEFVRSHHEIHENQIQAIEESDGSHDHQHSTGNLKLQNKLILTLVEKLESYIFKASMAHETVLEKLNEIDRLLIDLDHDMDFVKEMIIIDQTVYDDDDHNDVEDGCYHGNEDIEDKNGDRNESAESSTQEGTQISSLTGLDDHTRMHAGMKRLKATYAYSIKKQQQKKRGIQQPFVKPFMLSKYKQTWQETTLTSYNKNRVNPKKKEFIIEKEISELDNLFDNGHHLLLTGEAGTGKTFLVHELITQWKNGELLEDIEFLFLLTYKQVEGKGYKSMEEALKELYPNVFEVVSYEELLAVPDRMLFIFEGWGDIIMTPYVENKSIFSTVKNGFFSRKKEENKINRPETRFLMDVICNSYLCSKFLTQRSILTMRPNSSLPHFDFYTDVNFNTVDILGFNHEGIQTYVSEYFKNQKRLLRQTKCKMEENRDFKDLLRIPSNLHALCVIVQGDMHINFAYQTTTELYFAKLMSLINNKKTKAEPPKENGKTLPHQDPVLVSSIVEAAQISYQNATEEVTEEGGMFTEYEIQDILTSIYLYMMNVSPEDIRLDYRLENCLPFVAGLHGIAYILDPSKRTFMTSFISSLHVCQNCDFVNQLFQSYLKPTKEDMQDTLDNSFLVFLRAYFEYQGYLGVNSKYKDIKLKLKLHNMSPSDVTNLIYFLTHEWNQLSILHIDLHTEEPITQNQMEELAKYLLNIPSVKLDFKSLNDSSDMFTNVCRNYQNTYGSPSKLKTTKDLLPKESVKLETFELAERNVTDKSSDVKFDWLVHLQSLRLHLNTPQVPKILQSLANAIPKALENDTRIKLTHLQLKIPLSQEQLIPTLTILLRSFIYIHVFELEIIETEYEEVHSPYHDHKENTTSEFTDMSSIKYVLYKSLNENILPRNIRRFKVTDEISNYEFIINNRAKKITFVLDNNDEQFVDVELLSF